MASSTAAAARRTSAKNPLNRPWSLARVSGVRLSFGLSGARTSTAKNHRVLGDNDMASDFATRSLARAANSHSYVPLCASMIKGTSVSA